MFHMATQVVEVRWWMLIGENDLEVEQSRNNDTNQSMMDQKHTINESDETVIFSMQTRLLLKPKLKTPSGHKPYKQITTPAPWCPVVSSNTLINNYIRTKQKIPNLTAGQTVKRMWI